MFETKALRAAAVIAAAMAGTGALAQDAAAVDESRWRFLSSVGDTVVIIADDVEGQSDTKKVVTYTAFGKPHSSGAEGYTTDFEVNCQTETLKDLGSTAFAGQQAIGRMPSQTKDEAVHYDSGTLFGDIAAYACFRRVASGDRNVIRGRADAVAHARKRAR